MDVLLDLKNHYFTMRYLARVSFASNDCPAPHWTTTSVTWI